MPLPPTHVKEKLSLAYVQAVVASAGAHYNPEGGPEYGIDCTIKPVTVMPDGSYNYSGYPLFCQVKSTTDWAERGDHIIYDMEAKAYNKLASQDVNTTLLILYKLPKNEYEWVYCTEEDLTLRNCCYWAIITDGPVANSSSKRIEIPRNQVFNPEAVIYLLNMLRQNKGCLS